MEIAVIGTGYVGLTTAIVFAELGNNVIGVDIDEERVCRLNCGLSPIYEQGLDNILRKNIYEGNLYFTCNTSLAVCRSDMIFITVGTPTTPNGFTDLSQVISAVREVAAASPSHGIIINKSTVPIGTTAMIDRLLTECASPGVTFDVLSNPEFLRESTALNDALKPDRVIIGADSPDKAQPLIELYRPLNCRILCMDIASAEMTKYACNAFLAAKISFINDMSVLCEELGADIREVAKGMGSDPRIGENFLNAGIGFGGSCFPKDIESLINTAHSIGYTSPFLEATREVNAERIPRLIKRMRDICGNLAGKTIAVLGLTFKPNTGDLRESRSIEICSRLLSLGACVCCHDPVALKNARSLIPDALFFEDPLEAAVDADIVILATEWDEYLNLDLSALKNAMRGDLFVDGRNAFDPAAVDAAGLHYLGVGFYPLRNKALKLRTGSK